MNTNNRGNNNNNNRRRGRGNNNRPQGNGGGQQLNRVDSRARGNAPQLLEKYRKLAQDAHLNGDRVTAEYYLQFADHYFRVLADARLRQEEQRGGRQNERWQEQDGDSEAGDNDDYGMDADFPGFDQQQQPRQETRRDEPRPERAERSESGEASEPSREFGDPDSRGRGRGRDREDNARDGNRGNRDLGLTANPSDNPFVRDNSAVRQGRPRREESAAPVAQNEDNVVPNDAPADDEPQSPPVARGRAGLRPRRSAAERARDAEQSGLDPASLPPAIGGVRADPVELDAPAEVAPRRRTRRLATRNDDTGDTLEAVNG